MDLEWFRICFRHSHDCLCFSFCFPALAVSSELYERDWLHFAACGNNAERCVARPQSTNVLGECARAGASRTRAKNDGRRRGWWVDQLLSQSCPITRLCCAALRWNRKYHSWPPLTGTVASVRLQTGCAVTGLTGAFIGLTSES